MKQQRSVVRLALIIAFAVAVLGESEVKANLIDLTPGGVGSDLFVTSAAYQNLFHPVNLLFFDDAAYGTFDTVTGPAFLNGWVSKYGVLNGGQYFFTDLFTNSPTNTANIWWDFTATDFWLTEILVFGRTQDVGGLSVYNGYMPLYNDRFISPGNQVVSLPAGYMIKDIAFYGLDTAHVPDTGSTPALLVAGFAAIFLFFRSSKRFGF